MGQLQPISLLAAIGFGVCTVMSIRLALKTRDDLFWSFSLALGLLAVVQTASSVSAWSREDIGWLYLVRLVAFLVVIIKILKTNLAR